MASTTFVDNITVVEASWLNDVNGVVWTVFGGASTVGAARTALGLGTADSPTFGGLTLTGGFSGTTITASGNISTTDGALAISKASGNAATFTDATTYTYAIGPSGIGGTAGTLAVPILVSGSEVARFTTGGINGVLGATTPAAATVTTLAASGVITSGTSEAGVITPQIAAYNAGNVFILARDTANNQEWFAGATSTSTYSGSATNVPHSIRVNNSDIVTVASTGLAVTGTLAASSTISAKQEGSASVLSGITLTNAAGTYGSNWQFDTSGNGEFWSFDNGGLGWNRVLELGKAGGLDVTGTLAASGNASFLNAKVDDGNWFYWGASGDSRITGSSSADEIYLYTNNSQRVLVNNSGLAVTGTLAAAKNANADQSFTLTNTTAGTAAASRIDLVGDASGGQLTIAQYNTSYSGTVFGITAAKLKVLFDNSSAANSNGLAIGTSNSNPLYFVTNGSEKARINGDGELLLNTTSQWYNSSSRLSVDGDTALELKGTGASTTFTEAIWHTATSGDNSFIYFATEGSPTDRGSITYNRGGGLVAYNTTSDYRSKDVFGLFKDAGSIIDAIPVYLGKMKGASIERPMVIAHEVAKVAPWAVTGEKDAIDKDGNPIYQQFSQGAMVELLIAEVKALRSRVKQLEG